jgi:DMSO/TMAO reductase YedYZ molybdopterin-dependent catalytic subunit
MFTNRKELEDKMRQEGRMPPGQILTDKFPVLHYGPIPSFDESTWNFKIWGAVEHPVTLSWAEFNQLPRVKRNYDLHCVTRWSKFDTEWEGVSVKALVDDGVITPKAEAKFVMQRAEYEFSANLPLEIILSDRFILGMLYQGKPLTPEHGYPLRGVVGAIPGEVSEKDVYFWKGAKWLRGLEFMTEDHKGFWEMAGYHNDARIWEEERIG